MNWLQLWACVATAGWCVSAMQWDYWERRATENASRWVEEAAKKEVQS